MEVIGAEKQENYNEVISKINELIIKADYNSAKAILLNQIKTYPYTQAFYKLLGYVYEQLNDIPKSLRARIGAKCLNKSDKMFETTVTEWKQLIQECESYNLPLLVESCCLRLQRLVPENISNHLKLADIYLNAKKPSKAVACYKAALEASKNEEVLQKGLDVCFSKFAGKVDKEVDREQNFKMMIDDSQTKTEIEDDRTNEDLSEPAVPNNAFDDFKKILNFNDPEDEGDVEDDKSSEEKEEKDKSTENEFYDFFNVTNEKKILYDDENDEYSLDNLGDYENIFSINDELPASSQDESGPTTTYGLKKAVWLLETFFAVSKPQLRKFKMNLFEVEKVALLTHFYIELGYHKKLLDFAEAIPAEDQAYLTKEFWLSKAIAMIYQNKTSDLQHILEKIEFFVNPELKDILDIASVFVEMANIDEAKRYLLMFENKFDKSQTLFWYLLGYCYFKSKDYAKAEQIFLDIDDKEGEENGMKMNVRLFLFKIYSETNESKKAFDILKKPRNSSFLQINSLFDVGIDQYPLVTNKNQSRLRRLSRRRKLLHGRKTEIKRLLCKLELVSDKIFALAAEGHFRKIVDMALKPMEEILSGKISPRNLFWYPNFLTLTKILIRVFRRKEFLPRTEKCLFRLAKNAALYCDSIKQSKSQVKIRPEDVLDIILISADEFFKRNMIEPCYFCLRVLVYVKPDNVAFVSFFSRFLEMTKFQDKHVRLILRIAKKFQESASISFLSGFCHMKSAYYDVALREFFRASKQIELPSLANLYIGSCYLLQSKKRTCDKKSRYAVIGLLWVKKYFSSQHKNATACYNLSICYEVLGKNSIAAHYLERVFCAPDTAPKLENFISPPVFAKIPFLLKHRPGKAAEMAKARLRQIYSKSSETLSWIET